MATAKKAAPAKAAPKSDAAAQALEDAKKKFEAAQKKLQEKKQAVAKAKRTIATGDKKIATLNKKIEEEKSRPDKAVEILLKKAEDMEKKAAELEAEQEDILEKAEKIDEKVEAAEKDLETAKEERKAKMEELGISTKATTTRRAATGTAAERRAKNNFQYRLKTKGWLIDYNEKQRIIGAHGFGLAVDFEDTEFVIKKDDTEVLRHSYGAGSLIALANCVKEHGESEE